MYYVPSAQPPRTHLGATNARASAYYIMMLVVWDLKLQLQSRRFVFKKFQLFLAFLIVLDMHAMLRLSVACQCSVSLIFWTARGDVSIGLGDHVGAELEVNTAAA